MKNNLFSSLCNAFISTITEFRSTYLSKRIVSPKERISTLVGASKILETAKPSLYTVGPLKMVSQFTVSAYLRAITPSTIVQKWIGGQSINPNIASNAHSYHFQRFLSTSTASNNHQESQGFISGAITGFGVFTGLWGLYESYKNNKKDEYEKLPNIPYLKGNQRIERSATKMLEEQIALIKENVKICVIIGNSGMGKTELSEAYAYEYNEQMARDSSTQKRTIKFFHADKPEIFEDEYRDFAEKLGIDIRNKLVPALIDEVNIKLLARQDWLLIFDNVPFYQHIQDYIPKEQNGQKGRVILTMQGIHKAEINSAGAVFNLATHENRFTEDEAIELFNQAWPANTETRMIKISLFERLGFSPLSIKLIANFMAEQRGYINLFIQKKKILESTTTLSLGEVEKIILQTVKSHTHELLSYLVFLNPEAIEHSTLDDLANQKYGLMNSESIKLAIAELKAYCLLNLEENGRYKIHRSLKEAVLMEVDKEKILEKLIKYFKDTVVNADYPALEQKTKIPHLQNIVDEFRKIEQYLYNTDKYKYGELVANIAYILDGQANFYTSDRGDIQTASKLLEEAKKYIEKLMASSQAVSTESGERICVLLGQFNQELPDAYARILYSLGRQYFYEKNPQIKEKSREYLELSKAITEHYSIEIEEKKLPSLINMLADVSGLLYLDLEEGNNEESLLQVTRKYDNWLGTKQKYVDKDGLVKDFQNPDRKEYYYNHGRCHRQLASAYSKLANLVTDNRQSYVNQAIDHALKAVGAGQIKDNRSSTLVDPLLMTSLNILADTLLITPILQLEKVQDLFKSNNSKIKSQIDRCKNNRELAQIIFEYIIEQNKGRKSNFQQAYAQYQLAHLYLEHNNFREAKLVIDDSVFIQKQLMKRSDRHPELKGANELQNHIQGYMDMEREYNKLYLTGIVEVRHMVATVFDNPLLNHPQQRAMLEIAYKQGGGAAMKRLIDLGLNQRQYQQFLNHINSDGLSVAIEHSLYRGIKQRENLQTIESSHAIILDSELQLSQLAHKGLIYHSAHIIGVNEQTLAFTKKLDSSNSYANKATDNNFKISSHIDHLILGLFISKELIESAPMLRYVASDILHMRNFIPQVFLQTVEIALSASSQKNHIWFGLHYLSGNLGVLALKGSEINLAHLAMPIIATSVYAWKQLTYSYLTEQKQLALQGIQGDSLDNPIEFIEKCGVDIVTHIMLGFINGGVSKIIFGMPFPAIAYDMIVSGAVGGMQCYASYQQIEHKEAISSKTTTEQVIPYVADSIILYATARNMNFDNTNLIATMLTIKQSLAALSAVVITDQITKAFLQTNYEIITNMENLYINSILDYVNVDMANILGNTYSYFIDK